MQTYLHIFFLTFHTLKKIAKDSIHGKNIKEHLKYYQYPKQFIDKYGMINSKIGCRNGK